MNCWICRIETDRIFCGIICARTYHRYFTSIIMNHSFVQGGLDSKCRTCGRRYMDHTASAQCESCSNTGLCSIIDGMLLCDKSCAPKQEAAIQQSLNSVVETKKTIQELARDVDISLSYTGDVFNTEIIASSEIKREIDSDPTLSELEKHQKFNNIMTERILLYRQEMIEADNTKFNRGQRVNGALEYLRQFAGTLEKELKAKIKEQDKTYQPIIKAVRTSASSNNRSKTPQQRIQESLIDAMAASGTQSINSIIEDLKAIGQLPTTYTTNSYEGKYKNKIVN